MNLLEIAHATGWKPTERKRPSYLERQAAAERLRFRRAKHQRPSTVHGVCAYCGGPIRHVLSRNLDLEATHCSDTCLENSKNRLLTRNS